MTNMDKLAWMSYFREFRWGKLKKNGGGLISGSAIYVYILVSLPTILMDLSVAQYLIFLIGAIPMVITAWTMTYSTIRLPKLLFMGPATKEDRRYFLNKLWNIRFWFPNVIAIIAIGTWGIFRPDSLVFGLLIMFQNILLSCGVMFSGVKADLKARDIALCVVQWLLGMIGELILLYYYATQSEYLMKNMMITFGLLLAIQLLIVRKLLSYKQKILDSVIDYEKTYLAEKKKEVEAVW